MVSKTNNSYCDLLYAPLNGSNIRKERKQITKQLPNSNPIMDIYFTIIFEFTWYASFTLTVSIEGHFKNGLALIKAKFTWLDQTKAVNFFLGYPEFISVDIFLPVHQRVSTFDRQG